ncbi:MAG: glycosyltransferase [Bacteroidetes bacterium]|nr:glycosyltransferase [Bacteroidota bacterium]
MAIRVLVISDYRETNSVRPEAEMFIGLHRTGVQVTVMTFGEAAYATKFKAEGIRVIDFHPIKKFDKAETKKIRSELEAGQYQILHLFNSPAIINGIRASKGLPVKVVLYRGYEGNVHWYDPSAYFKYLHPRVDKIICITKSNEQLLRRQFFLRKNKVISIRKGHDLSWYSQVKEADLGDLLGISANDFNLICVANNRPMKGIRYLLEATYLLPTTLPINIILVGKDMDMGEEKQLIAESPNRSKIHLLGYRTDVLNLVAATDAFILTSIKGEAITKAVVEAMSLGVTPVITDIPGNAEVVLDGVCGIVVPTKNAKVIAEAILRLYHDRILCKKLGSAAKEHIREQFNIENTIRETKAVYESLIG